MRVPSVRRHRRIYDRPPRTHARNTGAADRISAVSGRERRREGMQEGTEAVAGVERPERRIESGRRARQARSWRRKRYPTPAREACQPSARVGVGEPPLRGIDARREVVAGLGRDHVAAARGPQLGHLEAVGARQHLAEQLGPADHPDAVGSVGRGERERVVDGCRAHGAVGRPVVAVRHDDVRAPRQRAEPRRQRLPRLAAHDHGRAERDVLEVRQVFGHVPRHAAGAADHAARTRPRSARSTAPTASAGLIPRRPRGWRGGAGSPPRRSRRTRSRRSSRACGRSGGSAPGTARA